MVCKSINLIPEAPIAEMTALAVLAETLGFDRCWVYDEGLATRDLYVTLTAIALSTDTMEIGPGITNPYTRHPAQTAAAIASLDEVSQGRAFLGIGAGGSLTLDPLGLPRPSPLTAVRETIEASRSLWAGGPVDFDRAHLRLRSARLDHARSDIEIWLAGRGPKMLTLGGAAADGVMLDFIHRPSLADYVALVRDGAASTGGNARICYSTAIVLNDEDREAVRPHLTYRLVDAPAPVKEALGLTAADVDRIRDGLRDGLQAAAEHVRDEWIEPFVIDGTADECADRLGRLIHEHGIEEFLLPLFDMPDTADYLRRAATVMETV